MNLIIKFLIDKNLINNSLIKIKNYKKITANKFIQKSIFNKPALIQTNNINQKKSYKLLSTTNTENKNDNNFIKYYVIGLIPSFIYFTDKSSNLINKNKEEYKKRGKKEDIHLIVENSILYEKVYIQSLYWPIFIPINLIFKDQYTK